MIQKHKTSLYVSGISPFLQFFNLGRGGGRGLFCSTWKSKRGALIRAGAFIRENMVVIIQFL